MRKFLKLISRFSSDQKGAIAIIVALAMVPIMAVSGAAIDYSRAFVVQNRLANALDAASLAMGASNIVDEKELAAFGQKFFEANYPEDKLGVPSKIQVTVSDKYITATASAQLPTSLMGFIGINHLDVHAAAQVMIENKAVEVAMVLDNSGSMYGSKISALKTSSKSLIDTLVTATKDSKDTVKIALVPFSSSVNVGAENKDSGWMDTQNKSPIHGINFKNKPNVFGLFDKIQNKSWGGCVEAREYPLDVRDTVPSQADGKTLWVPYFQPDEPDNGYYVANYLNDKVSGSQKKRQKNTKKYKNAYVGGSGPNTNCPEAKLLPLTKSVSTAKAAIDDMEANGGTIIPMGLAWGWRVLSPEAPFNQGAAYESSENPTIKAIVLMTDGANFMGALNNHNKSWYQGYGYLATQKSTNRLNETSGYQAERELDNRVSELCQNIKHKGIVIFTIAFEISNNDLKQMMKTCASESSKYFDAGNSSQLLEAFKAIGKELGELRLTK